VNFLLESPSVIEGIGPQHTKALAGAGVETIADLFAARARKVARLLPGLSHAQVGALFCAATLLRVEGVTPDLAEAFVAAGIRSVASLADAGLQTLENAARTARAANRLHEDFSLYRLSELQRNAWRTRDAGMLAGRVLDKTGQPIDGAVISIGRQKMTTDTTGRYAFDRVPAGRVDTEIQLPGRARALHLAPRQIEAARLLGPIVHTVGDPPAQPLAVVALDELDGVLIAPSAHTDSREVTLPLGEFRQGTHFLLREISGNTARLLSLYKKRRDDVILIDRLQVPTSELPAGAKTGDVLILDSGKLVATGLTPAAVGSAKWDTWRQTTETRTRRVLNVTPR
jgi:hypothetical protein